MTARTVVVTGSASGIGAAVAAAHTAAGDTVIGIDLKDADLCVDLSTPEGRSAAVNGVTGRTDAIDVVVACAGISAPIPLTLRINYFGTVALLDGLRPLLARSAAPRAVAVTSFAATYPPLRRVAEACAAGDEETAIAQAEEAVTRGKEAGIYSTSKYSLVQWIRRTAVLDEWAGAGITLNGVGPGMVDTPMIREQLEDPELRAQIFARVPMPLHGPVAAAQIGTVIGWLSSPENSFVTGQNLFADGGGDAVRRPDHV
ncbi:SDR family oxidoreductase [Nakamurella sp. YIM 132087]|uniref:SDR family oxidoreductase n=1 Tax=Nakamurella alba TaxID=2665158 RepID=A0A7K1FKP8_9ACTN|nr:SDR family oxidoreductase [Nakamurella alba]MTD13444.1 SDR family oxidoreductase [Nakamurella alba]